MLSSAVFSTVVEVTPRTHIAPRSMSRLDVARLAHAVAYFNHPSPEFFARLESVFDKHAIKSLAPSDLCMLLWAFAAANNLSEKLFEIAFARMNALGKELVARPMYQLYQADLSARIHRGGGDGRGQEGGLSMYVYLSQLLASIHQWNLSSKCCCSCDSVIGYE